MSEAERYGSGCIFGGTTGNTAMVFAQARPTTNPPTEDHEESNAIIESHIDRFE